MNAATLLDVQDLSVRFETAGRPPVQAVTAASFSARRGEVTALCGPSGAGKSAVGLCLLGLLPASARLGGKAELEGTDLCRVSEQQWRALRGRQVAGVYQQPHASLNPVMSIGRQLDAVCRVHQCQATPAELLERVGLRPGRHWLTRFAHQLSGGQAQRVLIAMALACRPSLLIADEPTAALDAISALEIMRLLRTVAEEREMALILISHDERLVARFSDQHVWLEEGRTRPGRGAAHSADLPAVKAPPPQPPALLQTRGLTIAHGEGRGRVTAIDSLDLEVYRGEVLALVGASGSGKSSLARAIVGLVPVQAGKMRFANDELHWQRPQARWRAGIQMLFQDPYTALNPRRRIAGALAEALEQVGRPASDAARCLEQVGLTADFLSRFPHQLSGGQRQRVAIARALAVGPELLILDEAFSALDIPVRQELTALLLTLRQKLNLTCLMISHDLARLEGVADRIAVLHEGHLVECGETAAVMLNPAHRQTRRLLAALAS